MTIKSIYKQAFGLIKRNIAPIAMIYIIYLPVLIFVQSLIELSSVEMELIRTFLDGNIHSISSALGLSLLCRFLVAIILPVIGSFAFICIFYCNIFPGGKRENRAGKLFLHYFLPVEAMAIVLSAPQLMKLVLSFSPLIGLLGYPIFFLIVAVLVLDAMVLIAKYFAYFYMLHYKSGFWKSIWKANGIVFDKPAKNLWLMFKAGLPTAVLTGSLRQVVSNEASGQGVVLVASAGIALLNIVFFAVLAVVFKHIVDRLWAVN